MIVDTLTRERLFNHQLHITYTWLAVVNAMLFFSAYYVAIWIYMTPQLESIFDTFPSIPFQAAIFATLITLAMLSMGLYQPRLREKYQGILLRTLGAFVVMVLFISTSIYLIPGISPWYGVFICSTIIAFCVSIFTRIIFSNTVKMEQFNRRVLILGTGNRASNIAKKMRRKSDHHGFRIFGYVQVSGEEPSIDSDNIVTLNGSLSSYVREQNIHQVVVALDNQHDNIPADELLDCRMAGVAVLTILDFFEQEASKVLVEEASPEWFIFAQGFKRKLTGNIGKRVFDVASATLLLAVSWPVMVLTVIAIKLEDGFQSPVIFRQERVGLNGQVFKVMKFRSMTVDAEADGKARWATANDVRATRVGQLIRKLRIDELPQLINVLIGNMAFVGPRPERPEFVTQLAREIPYFDKRHCVKPGITGWAQLNYPYGASVSDARHKLEFDLYYVKNQSLFLDFMVLIQTVEVVVFGKGAH